jgi:transposase
MPAILDTPRKSQILGALRLAQYLRSTQGQILSKREIARIFDVHPNTVLNIERAGPTNARTSRSLFGETRGRKRKLSDSNCEAIVKLYNKHPGKAPEIP